MPENTGGPPSSQSGEEKVKIHFKAVGNAPIMKQMKCVPHNASPCNPRRRFMISAREPFRALELFLRNELKVAKHERLFLYCDSAFAPSPEEPLRDLLACFGSRGELVVNYSTTGAYG